MGMINQKLHLKYNGRTYDIPLYNSTAGMSAYSYLKINGTQAYINLVAENSDLATTPLHIKDHTGTQFRVTDRKICKVTVQHNGDFRDMYTYHRGNTYKNNATFYAIAGESIRVQSTGYGLTVVVNGTDSNTSNYTFTIWGDANITLHYPSCSDSSGCGGEGG